VQFTDARRDGVLSATRGKTIIGGEAARKLVGGKPPLTPSPCQLEPSQGVRRGHAVSGQGGHRVAAHDERAGKVGSAATTQAERVSKNVRTLPRCLRWRAGGARMDHKSRMSNEARIAPGARMAEGRTQTGPSPADTAPPPTLLLKKWPGAPPTRRFSGWPSGRHSRSGQQNGHEGHIRILCRH